MYVAFWNRFWPWFHVLLATVQIWNFLDWNSRNAINVPNIAGRLEKCLGGPSVMWWPGISRTSFYSWLCRDSSLSSELSISSSSPTPALVSESPIAIWTGVFYPLTITVIQAIIKNLGCKILCRYHFSLAAVPYHHSSHCWKNEAKDENFLETATFPPLGGCSRLSNSKMTHHIHKLVIRQEPDEDPSKCECE